MKPNRHNQLPLGVIHTAFGRGHVILMVDTNLFNHTEIAKLAAVAPAAERGLRYIVASLPDAAHDTAGGQYVVGNAASATVRGAASYDSGGANDALAIFDAAAQSVCGKPPLARGIKALQHIGTEY